MAAEVLSIDYIMQLYKLLSLTCHRIGNKIIQTINNLKKKLFLFF
jgi:hypothetical protein